MANDAKAGDGQRDLGVIDAGGRIPGEHRMAGRAILAGGRVVWAFALRDRAVVAGNAAAHHLAMVEMHVGTKRDGVVARGAVVARRDVRRRLRRRVEGRA